MNGSRLLFFFVIKQRTLQKRKSATFYQRCQSLKTLNPILTSSGCMAVSVLKVGLCFMLIDTLRLSCILVRTNLITVHYPNNITTNKYPLTIWEINDRYHQRDRVQIRLLSVYWIVISRNVVKSPRERALKDKMKMNLFSCSITWVFLPADKVRKLWANWLQVFLKIPSKTECKNAQLRAIFNKLSNNLLF